MTWNATLDLLLRRLDAVQDPGRIVTTGLSSLDERTQALVRIGAAICEGAPDSTYIRLVDTALHAGASEEDVLGAFLCVAALAGEPRVVAATPRISSALGYDIEDAFEYG